MGSRKGRSLSRKVRRVSVTPSPSPPPGGPREPQKRIASPPPSPPRFTSKGGGKGNDDGGGKGMGKVGEVDEGWLKDRNAVRAKAHFTMLMMFPRSPTPVRETEKADVAAPVQMTPEEEARAKKFQ